MGFNLASKGLIRVCQSNLTGKHQEDRYVNSSTNNLDRNVFLKELLRIILGLLNSSASPKRGNKYIKLVNKFLPSCFEFRF